MNIETEIEWLVQNWGSIPAKFKTDLQDNYGSRVGEIPSVPADEHFVVLLLDRQKPSVEAFYDFDEERIAVTKSGKVIWGFDSGCSCPSPWHDSYPACYSCTESWKMFEVNLKSFDAGVIEECLSRVSEIRKASV